VPAPTQPNAARNISGMGTAIQRPAAAASAATTAK
jgi:hypothetical protein